MHRQFKGYFDRALSGESFAEVYSRPEKLKDGTLIWIELNGHPIYQEGEIKGATFFARTITQRKQAELKIRESEANYRMLFEHSPLPKILLYMDTWQIIKVNQAALSFYGYQKEEMVGRNFNLFLKEEEKGPINKKYPTLKERETKVEPVCQKKKMEI